MSNNNNARNARNNRDGDTVATPADNAGDNNNNNNAGATTTTAAATATTTDTTTTAGDGDTTAQAGGVIIADLAQANAAIADARKRATMATYNLDTAAGTLSLHASAVARLKRAGLQLAYTDNDGRKRDITYASRKSSPLLYNTLVGILADNGDIFYNVAADGVTVTAGDTATDDTADTATA